MVHSCCAHGCTTRHDAKSNVSFYRLPRDSARRALWVAAINRDTWKPSDSSRLCSQHFVGGKKSDNPSSPSYVPTIFTNVCTGRKRKQRRQRNDLEKCDQPAEKKKRSPEQTVFSSEVEVEGTIYVDSTGNAVGSDLDPSAFITEDDSQLHQDGETLVNLQTDTDGNCFLEQGTNETNVEETNAEGNRETNESVGQNYEEWNRESLLVECQTLRNEVMTLRKHVQICPLEVDSFRNNDSKVKYFTGLPSFHILMKVLTSTESFLSDRTSLTPFHQIVLTCVKLKLDLSFQFLAHLFGVSSATASRTFKDVIRVMDLRLVPSLVLWPDRELLRKSTALFRKTFNNCVCIIDCLEVFVKRPESLKAADSRHESQNAVRYLIGMTPRGAVSFVSMGWGARVSGEHIMNCCGVLENLAPGDFVLARGGFNVGDSVVKMRAFTKGKKRLDPLDERPNRALASLRFHTDRFMGLMRRKYRLLQSTIPTAFLQQDESRRTTLDRIVRVACALTNLSVSVVRR